MPSVKIIRGQYGSHGKGDVVEVTKAMAEHLCKRKMAVEMEKIEIAMQEGREDKIILYEKLKTELLSFKKNAQLASFAETHHLILEEDDSTIAEKAEKLLTQLETSFFDEGE